MKHVSSEALVLAATNRTTSYREPQDDRTGFDVRFIGAVAIVYAFSVIWWLSCMEHSSETSPYGEASTSEPHVGAQQVKRVAIIGAGSGGLAALKTLVPGIPKSDGQ